MQQRTQLMYETKHGGCGQGCNYPTAENVCRCIILPQVSKQKHEGRNPTKMFFLVRKKSLPINYSAANSIQHSYSQAVSTVYDYKFKVSV